MNTEHKVIEVVGGIIRRGDKYLLGKRPLGKSLGGHWEFIGGKIEPGETPCEALARECREEIALEIVNARVRTAVTHAYPDRTIHLTLIDCEPAPGADHPRLLPRRRGVVAGAIQERMIIQPKSEREEAWILKSEL